MGILNKMQQGFTGWFNKDNNANFLFVTAALGWALASLAQTVGLARNKELSKKDKKFLIPQEMADGAVNIGMYALVTTNLMKGAEKLAKPGRDGKTLISLKNEAGDILSYAQNQKLYAKMGRNLKTGAAILGGVISTCILTPVIRNAFGAYIKKKADKKEVDKPAAINNMQSGPLGGEGDIYPSRTQPYFAKTYIYPQNNSNPHTVLSAKPFPNNYRNAGIRL